MRIGAKVGGGRNLARPWFLLLFADAGFAHWVDPNRHLLLYRVVFGQAAARDTAGMPKLWWSCQYCAKHWQYAVVSGADLCEKCYRPPNAKTSKWLQDAFLDKGIVTGKVELPKLEEFLQAPGSKKQKTSAGAAPQDARGC